MDMSVVSLEQLLNDLLSQMCGRSFMVKQFLLVPFPEAKMQHYAKIVASEGETTVTQTCNNILVNNILLIFSGDWICLQILLY